MPSHAISPDLVDVFEEYPLVEASTFVPLAGRFRDDILPAHAMSCGQRLQNFQHVRQFRPQLPAGRRLRFLGLLHQLRPQRRQVPGLVQHARNGLTAVRLDDARYPVADELVIVEAHGLNAIAGRPCQDGNMLPFQDAAPTPAGDWRHIVRFGRNVASYKFALGRALLNLAAQQQTFVRLEDLSVPYAASICEHLLAEDRQSTSARSRFLEACRSRNRGELNAAQLTEVTVQLGFNNVIDAFHISRGGEPTQTRFFIDERAARHGITLTDHLLDLANGLQAQVLPLEVDAR